MSHPVLTPAADLAGPGDGSEKASAPREVRILPSELVNQIAAGEVIERPSSVVKELVENAIDAGARSIDITLMDGGRSLIEISDDGSGMSAVDALTALERHATSKIRTFDDLLAVSTLGFRGEALPSIASVSRLTLLTSASNSGDATRVECSPAGELRATPAARARGTTVRVAELFANVPARRKFLKSTDTEFRAIVTVVFSYALTDAGRAFRVSHNGRLVLDLPSAGDPAERVLQILGREMAPHLAPVEMHIEETTVTGFVTRKSSSRRNQFFFVNGRLVKDRVLTHAARQAAEAYDSNHQPAIVLFLDVDPFSVDVNVHPAKTEVRFHRSGQIHVAVEQGIRRALGGGQQGETLLRDAPPAGDPGSPDVFATASGNFEFLPPADAPVGSSGRFRSGFPDIRLPLQQPRFEALPIFQSRPVVQPPIGGAPESLGDLRGRVLGQYRSSYILIDTPEGLRIVDQHVAHERVLFDRFEREARGSGVASQRLLSPFLHDAGAAEAALLESHLDELRAIGFEIERFSGNTFGIAAIPVALPAASLSTFFRKVVEVSIDEKGSHLENIRVRMLASLACQAAIKVHRPMSGAEMSSVVSELLRSSNPFACPHGRPIIVDIGHADIEKHFHRR